MSSLNELHCSELLDMEHTLAGPLFAGVTYPWEVLPKIKSFILELGPTLPKDEYEEIKPQVWAARSAEIAETAFIGAPCIIGPETKVRHCAFIRESALIGRGCTIGNSTELKNVILFDKVEVPHYNYVGDSVLGFHAHMGAGSILSNIKADKKNIVIPVGEERLETGLRKMGAVLGDYVDLGCNSVINPGGVIGRNTNLYPLSFVRGFVPANSIYKKRGEVADKLPRD